MSPWVFIPSLVVSPIFQILLFAYIGRSIQLQNDEFYVIGNALHSVTLPCVFAMTHTIAGERHQQTLAHVLVTPAGRLPLFLGRGAPVILNGIVVAAISLVGGGLILGIDVPVSAYAPIALVVAVTAASCTGLGLLLGGVGLRVRETSVTGNIVFGLLLVFTGANVALDTLPGWMSTIAQGLPLTHGIEAARRLADGAALGDVAGLIGGEALVGVVFGVLGYGLLRYLERQARANASLEVS